MINFSAISRLVPTGESLTTSTSEFSFDVAGARRFPSLVPLFPDDAEVEENKAAWQVLRRFDKPFMCAFSDDDPVTAGGEKPFLEQVPGCRGVEHRTIAPAGHFLQQDQPGQCVQAILDISGRA